jgi:small subunit ribosomal protein S8
MAAISDPIADMLTRIRNANRAKIDFVDMPNSKMKKEIARILLEKGFIKNFEVTDESLRSNLRLHLKFDKNKRGSINGIKRISKPGLRIYVKNSEIPRVLGGIGIVVMSTSKGIIAGDIAKKSGLGGEIICYVW